MMKRLLIPIVCSLSLVLLIMSCSDIKRSRGVTYMPDMADSRAYETYSPNPVFVDGQTNREPVAGTVKRGELLPWHLSKDVPGDTMHYFLSRAVKSPLAPLDETQMTEAHRLYLVNCAICHGEKLDGDGPLYKGGDGPYPSKPATLVGDAKYETMPEGQMFYSVTYGRNLMGSYASQLDSRQRWMVIAYIKSQQNKNAPAATDSTAAATKTEATK